MLVKWANFYESCDSRFYRQPEIVQFQQDSNSLASYMHFPCKSYSSISLAKLAVTRSFKFNLVVFMHWWPDIYFIAVSFTCKTWLQAFESFHNALHCMDLSIHPIPVFYTNTRLVLSPNYGVTCTCGGATSTTGPACLSKKLGIYTFS
jgi:hypothetical protein